MKKFHMTARELRKVSTSDTSSTSDDDISSTSDDLDVSSLEEDPETERVPTNRCQRSCINKTRKPYNPPARVIHGGYTFTRRKSCGGREYWYCVVKGCKAGYILNLQTRRAKSNEIPHTHEPDVDPPDQAGNLAEVSLRMFVTDHFEMDSRDIYSLILKGEVQNKYEHFPDAASITIKRIQNIKGFISGSSGRSVIRSSLPASMAELDGHRFLQFQSVQPVNLIFATSQGMKRICDSRRCMLKRLRLQGNVIHYVYCVYAISDDNVIPAAWILFERRDSMPWMHFRTLLDEQNSDKTMGLLPRLLIVPCAASYRAMLEHILRPSDEAMGIACTYSNKVKKITRQVADEITREKLGEVLLNIADVQTETIETILGKVGEQSQSQEAKRAVAAWKDLFGNYTFLYHSVNMCWSEQIRAAYIAEKSKPMTTYETDAELIMHIHDLCTKSDPVT